MNEQAALKAIAEPRRRELLTLLRDQGTMSVGEMSKRVSVTQQAVSLHLKMLEEAGLVEARKEGTRHLYAIRIGGFQPVQDFVSSFWADQLAALKESAEKE
ncbi:Helix-turn-helix domain-containing protein [Aliiroseovarius halocynthiae]|uniref:Helix-turn-helix transcriptional regulator n=1 Tax=Aliiroseovarius halocynthiae TaxID=985055 RepID=A0A545SYE4_9RHOB|nr:helix-turn-helix domain-containing protein [Aliiroseovarius halocynthiae]TQV69983.1 helix-turn-helix transcriptional regulator [Aliiroseovarius halocynthiae]SMR70649.1 Helix-turn-helix domain-containing protein [Aliiroseovarius halocynthiae]